MPTTSNAVTDHSILPFSHDMILFSKCKRLRWLSYVLIASSAINNCISLQWAYFKLTPKKLKQSPRVPKQEAKKKASGEKGREQNDGDIAPGRFHRQSGQSRSNGNVLVHIELTSFPRRHRRHTHACKPQPKDLDLNAKGATMLSFEEIQSSTCTQAFGHCDMLYTSRWLKNWTEKAH